MPGNEASVGGPRAQCAARISRAIRAGDPAELNLAIEEALRLAREPQARDPLELEKWELLVAVAQGIRRSVDRLERGLDPRLEGLEPSYSLLRHLEGS